jgi:SAM-dependent MidA family methyltransferase
MMSSSSAPTGLPLPDPDSLKHSHDVARHLAETINATPDGFLPFEQWMQLALYAPGLGYYAAGSAKFGGDLPTGDFTTAPELTPLFGQTLAQQIAQVLRITDSVQVLEFGAGSGALASAIIPALRQLGIEPEYQILEVSADLRQRQQTRLAPLQANVVWLDTLPQGFRGCVIANEVLDAMPATLFRWDEHGLLTELGVRLRPATADAAAQALPPGFELAERPARDSLKTAVSARMPALPGYCSEINLQAEAWITQMGNWLERGAALLIDYGFPQREYYHPQRAEGTLMCHFRHHTHAQPLIYPGLQDITTHVDFTAMADAALAAGLGIYGYTSQARFLMNAGLPALLASQALPDDPAAHAAPVAAAAHASMLSAINKLTAESEMGELFKVLAIGRGIDEPLQGFLRGDRRDRL